MLTIIQKNTIIQTIEMYQQVLLSEQKKKQKLSKKLLEQAKKIDKLQHTIDQLQQNLR